MRSTCFWVLALLALVVPGQGPALARDLPVQGGSGGGPFRLDCPAGAFLVGVALRSGGWVDAVQGTCKLYLANRNLFADGASSTGITGGSGGSPQQNGCSPDRYVAGIKVGYTRDGDRPKYLDYVELSCAVISGYGGETKACLQTGDGCWDRHPGNGALGLSFQSHCAPGEMISGLIGRSGLYVDALGVACAPRPAPPPTTPPVRQPPTPLVVVNLPTRADAAFRGWLAANGIANASLVVMQGGALVGSFGYGARTAVQAVPVASLSKAITGICLSTLVDNGRLAYSDTIGNRLASFFAANPQQNAAVKAITIEQLLRHRSGIGVDPTQTNSFANTTSADQDIARMALASPLSTVPGSTFAYNNVNYALLGMVIQAVTGQDYETYCRAMLAPRGAPNAHIGVGLRAMGAFGGWEISAVEYANFARAFDRSLRLLSQASYALIETGPIIADGTSYMFGESVRRTASGRNLWHFGDWRANWTSPTQMGAYFALWDNGVSVVATYDRSVPDPVKNALDRALLAATH